ncbi:MAG: PAS domain S-box protein, partial [Chitinophagaceae bacterium]
MPEPMNLSVDFVTSSFFRNASLLPDHTTSFDATAGLRSCFHVFDHIDESFFFFDTAYRLLYLNKPGGEILKKAYGINLAVGENIIEKLPASRQIGFMQVIDTVLSGNPVDYELEICSEKMWIRCKYFPSYDANGDINGFYGVVKDITSKKEIGRLTHKAETMQQDLFQSRLLFEQFMQNSPLVAWLTDARGIMHYMNPVYLKTYGFTEAHLGKSIFELFPAQVAVDYQMNNQRVLGDQMPVETIENAVSARGEQQVLKIYKFPLRVNNEWMVGGWAADITDQVALQEKLIESVERHEYVNEATSDAIYDWDFTTGNLYRSSRFEEMFGFTEKKMSLLKRIRVIHPEDITEFKRVVFASLRNKAVNRWQIEYRIRVRDGSYRSVLDKAFIIRNARMLTEKTYQSIQTVINEIRRISHDLNPSAIVDVGLVEAIEQLIEKINLAGKIRITFVPDKRRYKDFLDEEDKIAIFRIVQEQLSNILKHANASGVMIRLEVVNGLVKLCIKDDGIGFDLQKCKKGLGLRNIYNRVDYYGGSIAIQTSEGRGCEMC